MKWIRSLGFRLALTALFAVPLTGCPGGGELEIRGGWVLMPPQGSGTLAGYGEVRNGTAAPVTITGAASPVFERAHLHRTVVQGGQASMRPVDALTIPPGGRAEMSPGGLHLMLVHPVRELQPGDEIMVEFKLDDGGLLAGTFVISHHQPGAD